MKKVFLGSLVAFALGLLTLSVINFYISSIEEAKTINIKHISLNHDVSKAINIKDKVIVQKNTSNTNYLNSWKLSATVLGSTSYAMLAKGKESKVLKLNDLLEEYVLKKIDKDKVLFSQNNDDIWVYMKNTKFENNNNVTKVIAEKGTFTMSKSYVDKYLAKPETLAKTINIIPVVKDGIFEGFHIVSLMEGTFFYSFGLRQGDYIKKINGKKLVSMSDGIYAYQNILTSKKFTISVLRNNTIKELKYEIIK